MKKTFTLIVAIMLTHTLFAFPDISRLTVSNMTKYPVKLVIDGKNYNDNRSNDNDMAVMNIRPGYHNIKIYQQKNRGHGNGRDLYNGLQLLYSGNLYIKPAFHTDIAINRFGKAFIDEQQMSGGYDDGDDDDHDWNNHGSNHGYDRQPMEPGTFEQFKQTISNGTYETTKINMAKQTIAANYFTAAQVKEIVSLFTYESSKLDMAKYAYPYSVDKKNYFIVSNALVYSNSKEELARFMQSNP